MMKKVQKKNVKNKILILMCGGHTIFNPKLPTTYQEYLDDDNFYVAIGEKKNSYGMGLERRKIWACYTNNIKYYKNTRSYI